MQIYFNINNYCKGVESNCYYFWEKRMMTPVEMFNVLPGLCIQSWIKNWNWLSDHLGSKHGTQMKFLLEFKKEKEKNNEVLTFW